MRNSLDTSQRLSFREPVRVGHIGLCVPDIHQAVDWYCDVFGLELLDGPRELAAHNGEDADMLTDVFGSGFKLARIAQLEAGGVGLELFEFVEPSSGRTAPASYFHEGFSHVCFTVPDIDSMVTRIRESGGKIRSEVWRPHPQLPYRFVHFEDPYGNLLELHSHPNRQMVNDLAAS